MTQLDHWDNKSKDFLLPFLENARQIVKIASGFFTVQGFNLFINALEGTTTFILVGYDDRQNKELVGKLLADVFTDLIRWDHFNRRQVVRQLVRKLMKNELYFRENDDEPYADARIRKRDHAKVYIIDNKIVLNGSVNSTRKGLVANNEGLLGTDDPERVKKWVQWFEDRWTAEDTLDLTKALLALLNAWLEAVSPFDIYLKSIQVLLPKDEQEAPREEYKIPAEYQRVIIKRVIDQLKTYRGAMLVASTGMGKTVMATDVCLRLRTEGIIDRVLVFAPIPTHDNWEFSLDSAGINHYTFSHHVLSQKDLSTGKGKKFNRSLSGLDSKTVLIIDESQFFRNENRLGGAQKRSFKRLMENIEASNCYVLLLTATPYAKGYEDLNNQLKLLPHTAPKSQITETGQTALPGFDVIQNPQAWRVPEIGFFEIFRKLDVVTLISTSWVAKNFGRPDPEGDFVERPDGKYWIPRLHLSKVTVPVPLDKQLSFAILNRFFKHKVKYIPDRYGNRIPTDSTAETNLMVAWTGSPEALREVLFKTINGIYEYDYIKDEHQQQEYLLPIYEELERLTSEKDPKLLALGELLMKHRDEKIIIFTERHSTAAYLENALKIRFSHRTIATPVIRKSGAFEFDILKDDEVQTMIERFAPASNASTIEKAIENEIDIIILTDKYSTGINLQDANVVINYDLAWTSDVIIQRAGRVMRFWNVSRTVYIYTFVGIFEHFDDLAEKTKQTSERFRKLTGRMREAEQITEMQLLPDEESKQINSLGDFSKVTIENIGELDTVEIEDYSGGSPFLRHITTHNDHEERANNLEDDIWSVKTYKGSDELIYVLLRYQEDYIWLVHSISNDVRINISNDELLTFLECEPETQAEFLDNPDFVEEQAQYVRDKWCTDENVDPSEVERICALYLIPENKSSTLEQALSTKAETWTN